MTSIHLAADADAPEPAAEEASPDAEAIARALQALLEEKEKEIASLKDQSLRALAEVENMRRRTERELADTAKYAVGKFAGDLVSVLENLQRAVSSMPAEARAEHAPLDTMAVGVEMTLKELLSTFEKYGIRRIDPQGEKFDHQYHQAVAQVASVQHPAGTVVQVLQAGYIIHERLLRPAMVAVASGEAAPLVDTQA